MKLKNQAYTIILLSLLFNCLSHTVSFGQQTWERVYGNQTKGSVVEQTIDGGYIVGGNHTNNMYLVKINATGDTLWTQQYGTNSQGINDAQQTIDGGYVLIGTENQQIYVVKTDGAGDTLWTQQYGAVNSRGNTIEQTVDGGYIIGGSTGDSMYLVKTDVNGNSLWTQGYSSSYMISDVEQTTDGGYILGGLALVDTLGFKPVPALIKTDSNGTVLWKTLDFELSYYNYQVYDVQQTFDGGYVLLKSYYPGDDPGLKISSKLIKVDVNGNKLWETHLGSGFLADQYIVSIDQTVDGGFICAGTVNKPIAVFGVGIVGNQLDMFLTRLGTGGNLIWSKQYGTIDDYSDEGGACVRAKNNGGFIATGFRANQMYVVSTDSLGNHLEASIYGHIFQDNDADCNLSTGDVDLSGFVVKAVSNQNASFTYYGTTNNSGQYDIPCQTGAYTLTTSQLSPYYLLNCSQNTGTITAQAYDTVDFPLEASVVCPLMKVEVSGGQLRMIAPSLYVIEYCNHGTATAQNAVVTLEIDSFLNVQSFSQNPTSQSGYTYTFNVGTVGVGQCGMISMYLQVDTSAIPGQTHCIEAFVTPDSLCLPTPWTGMVLDVNGTCQNDSIFFTIDNHSTNSTVSPRTYWVFEDDIIMRTNTVTVVNGGTEIIGIPAQPRKFYRIEVEQEPGIPWTVSDPIISAFVEGCLPDANGEFNVGLPLQFPNGHAPTFKAIDCKQNRGSFDPNNKVAQPLGYGNHHYINANQYIDYQINFQNTGSDTAFYITIIDTLSADLDPSSIQITGGSHPYTWQLKGNGILEVKFDLIMLPDSNVNEPASHGFIKFRIQQNANNPVGTIIHNFADIYFDLNAPVRTNTTDHEIGTNFYILTVQQLENEPDLVVRAFPNPFTQQTTIQVEGKAYEELTLVVYDLMGRQVALVSRTNTNAIELQRNVLESGIYVFKLLGDGNTISTGKIVAQ